MLGLLLGGFIVIVVGVNLLPTVANQVVVAQSGNISGTAASTVVGLVTLFFSLGVMAGGIALVAGGLRNAGVL